MTPRRFPLPALCLLALALPLTDALTVTGQEPKPTPATSTMGITRNTVDSPDALFKHPNLVAWCIVPFDDRARSPQERAEMMVRLGFKRYAYDYRAEHIAQFDAEMEAIKKHGIELTAWWFPTSLSDEARTILDVLRRHQIHTQLWVTGGGEPTANAEEQQARVMAEANRLRPLAEAAAEIGCSVALYNHGGWFGEPENQVQVIEALKMPNVGIVYNFHHGHHQVAKLPELMRRMMPHLWVLNINGMFVDGDKIGQKIVPVGQGDLDVELLRTIRDSGYRGPIGILNHTQVNAETRLQENLEGLRWITDQLDGNSAGNRPVPTSWSRPANLPERKDAALPKKSASEQLAAAAIQSGNIERGAHVFAAATSACLSCHRLGERGGTLGPDLAKLGTLQTPEQIAESVLLPRKQVKPEYVSHTLLHADGRVLKGYIVHQNENEITLRDASTGQTQSFAKADIESMQESGSLMPEGIATAMTETQRRDLIRFLYSLGRDDGLTPDRLAQVIEQNHPHGPVEFPYDRRPLDVAAWPSWELPVNRDRIYDYYAKQARYFRDVCPPPPLLPEFPGLDGGKQGHWGNQSEATWDDGRWNQTKLGSLQAGVFHGPGTVAARGVCLQLGDDASHFTCYNPDKLAYETLWRGGFLKFSSVRHGFMHGLVPNGEVLPRAESMEPAGEGEYRGFYRYGNRTLFVFRRNGRDYLDAPWVEKGAFQRTVAPLDEHPLKHMTQGGPAQWPEVIETQGKLGKTKPYAVDTITLPLENPWKALLFCGDHDFLPDGSAVLCTMQGDVWRVRGLEGDLSQLKWRRIASGLHHALGLVVEGEAIYVLGRDQITRLHDLNGDGEADFYECFSRACETSPAGHDFTCGLWRDANGSFYTASGKQGVVQITPDGKSVRVLATGLRNPDGLGLLADGTVTVPSSEGDWVPASFIGAIPPQGKPAPMFFGHGGPRGGQLPDFPLLYLPRGLDNSSGGQVAINSSRWGPFEGLAVHLSYGAGAPFILLRDQVGETLQGAVVPIAAEFRSGAHRGRFNPQDGQLYVSGMGGWGTYTPDDGCFQRLRYTGGRVQAPVGFHVHENGLLVRFIEPVDPETVSVVNNHFAQCWNYRYSGGYGSPEFSTRHPEMRGHDTLAITAAHVLSPREVFLEIPDLQPVNQLHLLIKSNADEEHDLYASIHRLDGPRTDIPGYQPSEKVILPHPMQVDLARATRTKRNPHEKPLQGAREIDLETGVNLSFKDRQIKAKAGEPIRLTLVNVDVVPHNWALLKPGTLALIGDQVNKLIADPDAAARQYIPESSDVLAYTDVVSPQSRFVVYFRAPEKPGRYPYLCTFPGHWMAMNGELLVE